MKLQPKDKDSLMKEYFIPQITQSKWSISSQTRIYQKVNKGLKLKSVTITIKCKEHKRPKGKVSKLKHLKNLLKTQCKHYLFLVLVYD